MEDQEVLLFKFNKIPYKCCIQKEKKNIQIGYIFLGILFLFGLALGYFAK